MQTNLARTQFYQRSLNNRHVSQKGHKSILLSLPLIRQVPCNLCQNKEFKLLFVGESSRKENFQVVRCKKCCLVQVNPQPNDAALKPYYSNNYFLKRTKRGYDNYYSRVLHREICRVYWQNLKDLGFFTYENEVFSGVKKRISKKTPRSLDAGCAAGYFVQLLQERGWNSEGIELAEGPVKEATKRGLRVYKGDFLSYGRLKARSYDMVSFWASIEHMQNPYAVFEQSHRLLKKGGRLFISTCRYGLLARLNQEEWRFMNVPEHLYFFSLAQIKKMARTTGFELVNSVSYGSGLTKKKKMSWAYGQTKSILDFIAKKTNQGDMMALHFRKKA